MRVWMGLMVLPLCLVLGGPARAEPTMGLPEVSLGANPYRSFFGDVGSLATDVLLSIPEGQDFIITMFEVSYTNYELLRGDAVILSGPVLSTTYIGKGRAKLRVEGGSTLSLRGTSSDESRPYFLQGYLVQASSQHRFATGRTPEGGPTTIWTSDSDQDFIVRTLLIYTAACEFYQDGERLLENSGFMFDGHSGGLAEGFGAFVIPASASLQLANRYSEPCDWFIEGEYIKP